MLKYNPTEMRSLQGLSSECGASCLLNGASCLLNVGRVVLGRVFFGASCFGASCLWGESSVILRNVVRILG